MDHPVDEKVRDLISWLHQKPVDLDLHYFQKRPWWVQDLKKKNLCTYCAYQVKYGPQREKTCLRGFANNKGADQPVHTRSLISTFVIPLLENFI